MNIKEAIQLGLQRAQGTITPADEARLGEWVRNSTGKEYIEYATACIPSLSAIRGNSALYQGSPVELEAGAEAILRGGKVRTLPVHRRSGWWIAASFGILSLGGLFYWLHHRAVQPTEIVHTNWWDPDHLEHPPTLRLANGTELAMNVKYEAARGLEEYFTVRTFDTAYRRYIQRPQVINPQEGDLSYRSIATPAGWRYRVIFPDSSEVLLNARSTLEFAGRSMRLKGEAFFTVAPDARTPFVVETRHAKVEVLGTRFNIKSYPEENADRVTLLSGAININNHQAEPGKQWLINPSSSVPVHEAADTTDILAWTKGLFIFNKVPAKRLLDEYANWYGLHITYTSTRADTTIVSFDGTRKAPLEPLLYQVRATGLKLELKGKELIVK